MAKNEVTPDFANRVIEQVIEHTGCAPFHKDNKAIDFKAGDIVRCSYMNGLFKVAEVRKSGSISVYHIDLKGKLEFVRPEFLEKVDVNPKTMEVLYHE